MGTIRKTVSKTTTKVAVKTVAKKVAAKKVTSKTAIKKIATKTPIKKVAAKKVIVKTPAKKVVAKKIITKPVIKEKEVKLELPNYTYKRIGNNLNIIYNKILKTVKGAKEELQVIIDNIDKYNKLPNKSNLIGTRLKTIIDASLEPKKAEDKATKENLKSKIKTEQKILKKQALSSTAKRVEKVDLKEVEKVAPAIEQAKQEPVKKAEETRTNGYSRERYR